MRIFKRVFALLTALIMMLAVLCSCVQEGIESGDIPKVRPVIGSLRIEGEAEIELTVGETRVLICRVPEGAEEFLEWSCSGEVVTVDSRGVVMARALGEATVTVKYGALSDTVSVRVVDGSAKPPHEHEYVDGKCECGESDPDFVPPHEHEFVGGKCECGATEPATDEFGSEYPSISVSEVLKLAEGYTGAASTEKYYIVVTIRLIESSTSGEMYVYDESGEIYVYKATTESGLTLSEAGISEGDRVVILGTLRNYRGLLEVQTGTILAVEGDGSGDTGGGDSGSGDSGGGDSGSGDSGSSGGGSGDTGNGDGGSGGDIDFTSDPYADMSKTEFYASYKPASCYKDAYYRNLHNFMSGSLTVPDAAPTISEIRPMRGTSFIKNDVTVFLDDGNTYVVYDALGVEAFRVYRGGGYITLEEVAAHMYAFGVMPANHTSSKSTKPTSSPWGEYLRVNHSKFSGDTSKYPYEPMLPDISGCGGSKVYYEMDIGTTGTDTGGGYEVRTYNNGSSIVRGAARIVYTWADGNSNGKIDAYLGEVYVFYTYNHYNDFQEYLNYAGGWGEMFGNITGGGTLSSKTDCNPTPYVPVAIGSIGAESADLVWWVAPLFERERRLL